MTSEDRQDYIERFQNRLLKFGYSPLTLGWGHAGNQRERFSVLAQSILLDRESSVLDVGCGFADLFGFLSSQGWKGKYTGIDIVPGLLEEAKKRYSNLELKNIDLFDLGQEDRRFDYVVASGIFNSKLRIANNLEHIQDSLTTMFRLSRIGVCSDFLSTYVDYRKDELWYTDPAWALQVAKGLSRRVSLRFDYMPFEFSLSIFKDDSVNASNVFHGFSGELSRKHLK